MARIARHSIATMFRFIETPGQVANEERERRLAICHACENWENGKCGLCRCPMSFKTRLEAAHCIDGKW